MLTEFIGRSFPSYALAATMFLAGFLGLTPRAAEKQVGGGLPPTFSDTEAIEHLKKHGQHDSLMNAFYAMRKEQAAEELTEGAFGQTAKLTASDGAANDEFGFRVAISGDTAIIGAYADNISANTDQGSAYVFVRSGKVWSQQQKLTAADGSANDRFGVSVAIFGETAIVGAYVDSIGPNSAQGSAYIFVRSGTVWSQQQKLTAADGADGDQFGISVAISDDTAIVGAHEDDLGTPGNQGAAYIFARSGTIWSEQQKLTASDHAAGDVFGSHVAISGETVIVGSPGDDIGTIDRQGSAYIFVRSGKIWSELQKLTASDGSVGDQFGSVAISGETAIVGVGSDDIGANANQGSVYVFVRSGTTWNERQKLIAADGAANDFFGSRVSISGETAIASASLDDIGANVDQGSAYVFKRSGSEWNEWQKLIASDGSAGDRLGIAAISGETVILGASAADNGANSSQGSAYVFTRAVVSFEGDVAPRNAGDGVVITTDVVQMRRFAAGLDTPDPASNEFQRADSSPRTTFGNGIIDSTDVVQARRYATGLDPLTPAAGPAVAAGRPLTAVGTRSRIRTYLDCIAAADTRASVITQPRALFWPRQALPCVLR